MSINSALLAGVSGLTANSAALAAISQNIANVNTVGYKRTAAEFSTVVNAQSQGAGYSAGGVLANTRNYISQGGQLQRTTTSTDLGIAGQGFFVTTEKAEGLDAGDARLFTRAGAFRVDNFGYLKNTAGLYLQGWPVNAEGDIPTDPSDLNKLTSINVGSVGGTAEATTRAQLNANLKSSQAVSADIATYSTATKSMSTYNATTGTGFKPDFQITIPVSDSKGGQRTVAYSFLKTANPNEWQAEVHVIPASDVDNGTTPPNGILKSGLVLFTQDGRLDIDAMKARAVAVPGSMLFADPSTASLTLASSEAPAGTATVPKWKTSLGIDDQTLSFDLTASAGGLTQYDSDSIVQAVVTNGTAFGNLSNIEIDEEGFVTAIFDNGVTRRIAQVALATFTSADSLTPTSGNAYRVSQSSGTYNLKTPGAGGSGMIGASQLEASTVDLSAEFTGLITTQRAYSASSKIITTADEMLAELISIKR
ncbi:transposase [Brevundimonas sp. LM2]|uniref:flagellar hook protein FlgE n=1 Tax=Brevundimonas sp. LM2 TaxID=1938605 RepID=UPI000983CDC9|nr:flagellar hook protein FlgE [Brevundimonas sp. LM2]AQR62443.1 transposase [Brevundimonas sp. LM2]